MACNRPKKNDALGALDAYIVRLQWEPKRKFLKRSSRQSTNEFARMICDVLC